MSFPVARLDDTGAHGGQIVTGSENRVVNGKPVARIGDIYDCPEHGPNQIVSVLGNVFTNNRLTAHVTAITECGDEIVVGSENVFQGVLEPGLTTIAALELDFGTLDDTPDDDDGLAIFPPVSGRAPTASERARSRALTGDPPPPAEVRNEEPPKPAEEAPTDCNAITENPPSTFRLSANFVLGDLSSGAALTKVAVRPNAGLTTAQIVCNLKAVAENCCEALAARYGRASMIITSGFRTNGNGSQHERGQAVDIQFGGISDDEYWTRAQWVKDNVPYDQFILEYLGRRPWFHLSFNRSGGRRQVLTAAHPGRYEPGLRKYR